MKIDTDIQGIIFLEATALLTPLEQKLGNSDLDLGLKGIQSFFAQSGVITNADMKEFLCV
ncbi:MAG: hypothetical protein K6U80_19385 [Firmicutes bacterium]|nr:hypothetical protein [Bacillota bacterium]